VSQVEVEVSKKRAGTTAQRYDLKDIRIWSWLHEKLIEIKYREKFKNMSQVIRYLLEKAGEL
jgi:plasmid replication initiation protein